MVQLTMDFVICESFDCELPARQAGLCAKHYAREKRGSEERSADTSPMPKCAVSHCSIPALSRIEGSLCQPHYQAKYRGIDPETRVARPNANSKHYYDLKCAVEECARRAQIRGCCKKHHDQIAMGKRDAPVGVEIPLRPMCSLEGCHNRQESLKQGLCHSHICQLLEGRELSPLRSYGEYVDGSNKCSIDSCKKPSISRGLCQRHLNQATSYKLTAKQLEDVLAPGVCENPGCGETKNLHIDHDHETGAVRGLLCAACNMSLGRLKEDVARIEGLAEYKRRHS